jgi:hypothetical protein
VALLLLLVFFPQVARIIPASGGAIADSDVSVVKGALARCEEQLAAARMARRPEDARACLRVAALELDRSDLLSLLAYERAVEQGITTSDGGSGEYLAWRHRLLRTDPGGALERATEEARSALALELLPTERRKALLLLAQARGRLADHRGEAEALAQVARRESKNAALWLRLSNAYSAAKQFAQAEAARERALAAWKKLP